MQKRYNNYHKHTHYSNIRTLDCIAKPEDYMKRAVELGHSTYFTTEHGFQGNIFEAQTLCEKYNLKPIYAVEAYYVDDMSDKTDRSNYHIMLIAMTKKARYEINKILSTANTKGFYYKPRIDLKSLLSLTPTDTIITTACVAGRLFKSYWKEKFLFPVLNHFKSNFYLEVQSHTDKFQADYNSKILEVSKEYGIKIIHANDSHYIYPEDSKYRDYFLNAKGIFYENESNFILDYPDYQTIVDRYHKQGILNDEEIYQALNNTLIFDNAEPIYTDKEFKIPKIIKGNSDEYLKKILIEAWNEERKKVKPELIPKYKEAINYEYNIVKKCGMADYFILNHIIVNKAVKDYNAVLTRSGRGSAVSFYINKLLGLTEVDRIKAPIKLYPTRFMSAERILSARSLPDIDLNFADVEPVIKASKDILGEDNIYYMLVYKPLQNSSAFRLWCKSQGMDINDYDEIAKDIGLPQYKKKYTGKYANDKFWQPIIEQSKVFKGVIESTAPSPCSFLLSNKAISEEIGLIRVGNEICCVLDGYNCDIYKYLKNDYLTVLVYKIIDMVYKRIGKPIDSISTLINNCDEKVWEIYSKGLSTTINQADSDYDKQILKKYKPTNLSEMSAYVAAIRPGFASLLNNFISRKPYSTKVKELDYILTDSYHYLMYQESIMSYLVWLGLEEKNTYDIIKKISKKKFKPEELVELKKLLLKGWINRVGTEQGFEETWQVVEDASAYSFNASHSLSVAIDSIYGAYLKSHYPLEYFEIVLTLYEGDIDRTSKLINELNYFNIKLKNIKFGKSSDTYLCDKETNSIYKSISSIKYCNAQIANELYELSKNKYDNFIDLLQDINSKTSVDSRQLEILTSLNFFSDFGENKKLLDIINIFNTLNDRKQIKKADVIKLNINENIFRKYVSNETEKLYKNIDIQGYINEIVKKISNKSLSIKKQIEVEKEYLGYISYINPKAPEGLYYVADFKTYKDKCKPYLELYHLKTGETIKTKVVSAKEFSGNPFKQGNVLNCWFKEKNKVKMVDGKWEKTDELEKVLYSWEVY